jgi:O-antigen/teichoic acid export membrane protein
VIESRSTLRHAGLLVVQRGFHVIAAAAFAVIVPRVMGPDVFGQYALMVSVSMWCALASGLGATSMMSRSVPAFTLAGDTDGLSKLVTNLIALRALTGVAAGGLYWLLTTSWFDELDAVALLFIAGSVWSRTVASPSFSLFLGLNQAARWGMGELLRRWLTLAFVCVGFVAHGLRGACLGVLAANVIVLAAGLWWGRSYLRRSEFRIDLPYLAPFLRTGAAFAAGNLALALTQRGGETLVRLATGDYAEVAYYGVASSVYLTAAHGAWQATIAFVPLLIRWRGENDQAAVREWLERLIRIGSACSAAGVLTVLFVGRDLVVLVLGHEYAAVARNLVPLTVALMTMSVASAGRLAALVAGRPAASAAAAVIEAAAFWGVGFLLATFHGSLGVSVAVLAASAVNAIYVTWRMRHDVRYSATCGLGALLAALVVAPLAWLPVEGPLRVLMFAACVVVYGALLYRFRILTRADLAALRRGRRT